MHTWKPDAYREAPSPAVVLMAVGMLNGALYCVLRIHLISKASLGPEFSEGLLLTLGLLSVLIATPFVLIQWNIKRLLAYPASSTSASWPSAWDLVRKRRCSGRCCT